MYKNYFKQKMQFLYIDKFTKLYNLSTKHRNTNKFIL